MSEEVVVRNGLVLGEPDVDAEGVRGAGFLPLPIVACRKEEAVPVGATVDGALALELGTTTSRDDESLIACGHELEIGRVEYEAGVAGGRGLTLFVLGHEGERGGAHGFLVLAVCSQGREEPAASRDEVSRRADNDDLAGERSGIEKA